MTNWAVGEHILDEYLLEKELGRGGMGRVWLAKSNSTGRLFAVKQTLINGDKHRKAFLAELQTWIDLPEHPNIVPCRFFRTVGEEIVIFADYVEGGSLADWIAEHRLTTYLALDVAIQIAWGLHAIHERGLIHQDVKPSNVLMTADGVPMVTDFGLARARLRADDGAFVSPALAQGDQSILVSFGGMTPAYASPEQRAGKPLSRKTDIWSWGVSILDIFMGGVSCPYGGHIAADVLESLVENGTDGNWQPRLPEDVIEVLQKCFSSDPTARWTNQDAAAQSLIEIFENVFCEEYGRKPPPVVGMQSPVVKHDRRVSDVQWNDPREWLREAYQAVGRNPAEADSYQPPAAFTRKGAGVAELALYEEAERAFELAIEDGRAEHNVRLAVLCRQKAMIYESLGDSSGAKVAHSRGIAIRERLVDHEGLREQGNQLANAYMCKANFFRQLGDLRGAVGLHDQSIAILEQLVKLEGRGDLAGDLAMAYLNKSNVVQSLGDYRGAAMLYDRCIAITERLVELEGRGDLADCLATAYRNKGLAVKGYGDLRGAVELYDRCIAIQERLVEREGRSDLANNLAAAYNNKALAVQGLGDRRLAVELYDQCIAIRERLVESEGRSDIANQLATAYMNKANAVKGLGNLCGAVELYDRCIAIRERMVESEGRGDIANELAMARMNKAATVQDLGDLRGATDLYDRCIATWERMLASEGRNDLAFNLAAAYTNKASLVKNRGDLREAVKLYDLSIALQKRLVEQERKGDLAGDLSRWQLSRAAIVLRLGEMTAEERMRTLTAFHELVREAERTGRTDFRQVIVWAKKELAAVLQEEVEESP